MRILYGGSVKPDNAAELFRARNIDGGLVGGASLDPGDFLAICEAGVRRMTRSVPRGTRLGPGRVSVCLVILDGWGLAEPGPGNAVALASTRRSSTSSGSATRTRRSPPAGVTSGFPTGQMGNSEVGHLNLGAGAVVKQDLARIDDAVADGTLFENEALLAACAAARDSPRGRLHLDGPGLRRRACTRAGPTSRR